MSGSAVLAHPPFDARVAVLAGGVGAARFLRGLLAIVDADQVNAIVNTGDDTILHGLHIAPDLDTITYTLADAIDPERGWGLAGETWAALDALERYRSVRPPDSTAAATWFRLGDRDLATHLYRTARLAEGASLTEVTAEITRGWGLGLRVLPMTDQQVATRIQTRAHGELAFQDYFVRLRHEVPITAVRFVPDHASPTEPVWAALAEAAAIVIAPSNPLVSIGPIRALDGIDDLLASRRDRVVAISPIVGGAAIKGPAARMLTELGHEPSVVGIAELYREIAAALVIDRLDADLADRVERVGMRCVVTDTVMANPQVTANLAQQVLDVVR